MSQHTTFHLFTTFNASWVGLRIVTTTATDTRSRDRERDGIAPSSVQGTEEADLWPIRPQLDASSEVQLLTLHSLQYPAIPHHDPTGLTLVIVPSYVMVAVSFIWILALPHQGYSKRTYVSENALLPGGVRDTMAQHLMLKSQCEGSRPQF